MPATAAGHRRPVIFGNPYEGAPLVRVTANRTLLGLLHDRSGGRGGSKAPNGDSGLFVKEREPILATNVQA